MPCNNIGRPLGVRAVPFSFSEQPIKRKMKNTIKLPQSGRTTGLWELLVLEQRAPPGRTFTTTHLDSWGTSRRALVPPRVIGCALPLLSALCASVRVSSSESKWSRTRIPVGCTGAPWFSFFRGKLQGRTLLPWSGRTRSVGRRPLVLMHGPASVFIH